MEKRAFFWFIDVEKVNVSVAIRGQDLSSIIVVYGAGDVVPEYIGSIDLKGKIKHRKYSHIFRTTAFEYHFNKIIINSGNFYLNWLILNECIANLGNDCNCRLV